MDVSLDIVFWLKEKGDEEDALPLPLELLFGGELDDDGAAVLSGLVVVIGGGLVAEISSLCF